MAAAVPPLSTGRLELRPLALTDAPAVQASFPRWEVVRYLGAHVPWPYPPDGALVFVRDVALPAVEAGTAWHWTVRRRDAPGRLVGLVNLHDGADGNRGFWIDPEEQGRGFATEAADAVTRFWFDVLGRPMMRIPKAVANDASRRISLGQCMRVVATMERDYVGGRLPAELWELTADEWRARQG